MSPRQLEEEFTADELYDFSEILTQRGKKAQMDRRREELMAQRPAWAKR